MALDVVVLGDVNPDLVLTGDVIPRFGQSEQLLDGAHLLIGGSGAIVAHGLARLGLDVALIAEVGRDVFGELMIERLGEAGVRTHLIRQSHTLSTGLSVVLSAGETRSTLTHIGAIDADPPRWANTADVPTARHLHVTSYYLQYRVAAELPRLLPLVREAGIGISMDTNLDPLGAFGGLREVLPLVDLLFPNATEVLGMARALGRSTTDLAAAAAVVAALGPTVVVKDGAHGAFSLTPAGERLDCPGRPITPVDTTGAGDSFAAGYLAAVLEGADPETALTRATTVGRLATTGLGGTSTQPTADELQDELRRELDAADHADGEQTIGAATGIDASDGTEDELPEDFWSKV